MKTSLLLSLSLLISINIFAQIKIFNGGTVSVGDINPPAASTKFTVYGNSAFLNDANQIYSSAFIRGLNYYSTALNPDYTWWGNDQTGIFHPRLNSIGFSIAGTETMSISELNNVLIGAYGTGGGYRLSIDGRDSRTPLATYINAKEDYKYVHISYVNRERLKNWAVMFNELDRFFVYGDGRVFSNGYYLLSDGLLKENIQTIKEPLEKIQQLRGVTYKFKEENLASNLDSTTVLDANKSSEMGLIAEEVESVVPEVIMTLDNGLKAIAYQNLIGLLIEAIKEQDNKISILQEDMLKCCENKGVNGSEQRLNNNPNKETPDGNLQSQDRAILYQNKPNPFKYETEIRYYLPESYDLTYLFVFDLNGKLLKQWILSTKGESSVKLTSNELTPGIYIYSMHIDGVEVDSKKMVLTE